LEVDSRWIEKEALSVPSYTTKNKDLARYEIQQNQLIDVRVNDIANNREESKRLID